MNRTRYFFALFAVVGCLAAAGQDTTRDDGGKAVFGIAVGPNFTRATLASYTPTSPGFGSYTSSKFGVGFDASVFVVLPIGATAYFRPELGFSLLNQKQFYSDSKFVNSVLSTNNSDKLTESQVSVNALFGYRLKPFAIELGPQLGIVTSAVTHSVSKTIAYNGTFYQDTQTDFKKDKTANSTVFAVLVGVSRMAIYKNFGAGIYYSLGLSDYTKYDQLWQIGKVSGFLLKLTVQL